MKSTTISNRDVGSSDGSAICHGVELKLDGWMYARQPDITIIKQSLAPIPNREYCGSVFAIQIEPMEIAIRIRLIQTSDGPRALSFPNAPGETRGY